MAYWINVYGTRSLGPLSAGDLEKVVTRHDIIDIAEWCDLPEEYGRAASRAIRVEEAIRGEGADGVFHLHYKPDDPDWWIRFARHTGDEAREWGRIAIAEKTDGTEPARIRAVLSATEDYFAFAVSGADHPFGRLICWYTAMDLAERGEGLVCMGGHEWWQPPDHTDPLFRC